MEVSIIIPVYNLERYISHCIESVLKQSYTDFELIIINDGSTDNSLGICREYEKNDSRIKIITQENGGASAARNAGLDVAQGKYIMFVDGDDIISSEILRLLIEDIEKNDVILSSCEYLRIKTYDYGVFNILNKTSIENSIDCVKYMLLEENFSIGVWGKLFLNKRIKDLRFEHGKKENEDKYFLFMYLLNNTGYVSIREDKLYGYYIRQMSATTAPFSINVLDIIFFSNMIYDDIKNNIPNMLPYAHYNLLTARFAVLKRIIRSKKFTEYKKLFKSIKDEILCLGLQKDYSTPKIRRMEYMFLKINSYFYILSCYIFDFIKNFNGDKI